MKSTTVQFTADGRWVGDLSKEWDSENTVVFVFGASKFFADRTPFRMLTNVFEKARIVGCSTSGEIMGDQVFDDTLSVGIVKFDSTKTREAFVTISDPSKSYEAGQDLASRLVEPGLRAILVFSAGDNVDSAALAAGINERVRGEAVVTGGFAGDGARFLETWVLSNGEPRRRAVSALALYGDKLRISYGSKGGFNIFGPERFVSRAEGSTLYEFDGEPALPIYKKYLGDLAEQLPAIGLLFPLHLVGPDTERPIVRAVRTINDDDGSIGFFGDIPNGYRAQLMRANFEQIISAAGDVAQSALRNIGEQSDDVFALSISCIGRRLLLGQRTDEELETTLEALPPSARQIGFYSYGELAPFVSTTCDLHNETMTMTLLSESA